MSIYEEEEEKKKAELHVFHGKASESIEKKKYK